MPGTVSLKLESRLKGTYHRLDIGVGHGLEHFVVELEFRADVNVSTLVFGRVAILGSGEDGDTAAVVLDLVTIHAHLVRADDCFQTVVLAEALGDVWSELEADSTFAGATAGHCLRVGPEHLHHQAGLAGLPLVVAVELADIVQGNLVVGEETAV